MQKSAARYTVIDHSWTVFGVAAIVILTGGGAYCGWRAFSTPQEFSAEAPFVEPVVISYPTAFQSGALPGRVTFPVADNPLSWQDLKLMVRTGLTDDEIIAVSRGKQLVDSLGYTETATLRELGAGNKLLAYLRTRPVYAAPPATQPVIMAAPIQPSVISSISQPQMAKNTPLATPMRYAERARQIDQLDAQISTITERILYLRNHPRSSSHRGTYNGRGDRDGEESDFKHYLDGLDKQRSDLQSQKWQLQRR